MPALKFQRGEVKFIGPFITEGVYPHSLLPHAMLLILTKPITHPSSKDEVALHKMLELLTL